MPRTPSQREKLGGGKKKKKKKGKKQKKTLFFFWWVPSFAEEQSQVQKEKRGKENTTQLSEMV